MVLHRKKFAHKLTKTSQIQRCLENLFENGKSLNEELAEGTKTVKKKKTEFSRKYKESF